MAWDAVSDADIACYQVQRATSPDGPWTNLTGIAVSGTTFTDANPGSGSRSYRVLAEDTSGNVSAASNTDTVDVVGAIRVNSGGPAVTSGGLDWVADTEFANGGTVYSNGNLSANEIAGTASPDIHLTERSGPNPYGYDVAVAEGTYDVTLHFAEIYFGAEGGGPGGAGQRVLGATVEGQPAATNLDIFAEVGAQFALTRTVSVTVTDGTLDIDLAASVNQAKLSGFEIIAAS